MFTLAERTGSLPDTTTRAAVDAAAASIRRRVLMHTIWNNGGYLTQACCSAEALCTLYLRVMNLGPSTAPTEPPRFQGVPGSPDANPSGAGYNGAPDPDHDRFILSPAHYAISLYSTLIEAGRLSADALDHFNEDGSTVEMIGAEHSPGMEATTGSLAQALSVGSGMAWARREAGESGRVFVYMSDGELQEGQTWEAFQAAANFGLDNLIVYLDANGFQCDGPTDDVMAMGAIGDKIRSFGWSVAEVDGHESDAMVAALDRREAGKPLMVLCETEPWHGIPSLKSRYPKLHYVRFKGEEPQLALADLGIDPTEANL